MGGPEEERIVDEALFRCQPELVVQGLESGGLRHDVRHVHVRRHASGRRRPIEKVGSDFDLPVDCVIMSLGTTPNPLIKNTTPGLEVNRKGGIVVNEEGLTSHASVYAGGDAVTGAATVILAMGAGKLGAKSIDEQLSKK